MFNFDTRVDSPTGTHGQTFIQAFQTSPALEVPCVSSESIELIPQYGLCIPTPREFRVIASRT